MKTLAPLPSWRDLTAALLGPVPGNEELSAPWKRDSETAVWFSRGAWALDALISGWASSNGGRAPQLWLPDYFCNQTTAPAREAGARLCFYPIGPDFEPKWDTCREMLEHGAPDLFVLVHYFGRPGGGAPARTFCDDTGALLVEDAAHVLRPSGGIGSWGDATLYCPHKLLPAPDGALLLLRTGFPFDVPEPAGRAPASCIWALKRALQKLLPGAVLARRRQNGPGFDADPAFQALPNTPVMSRAARRLLRRAGTGLDEAAATRRQTTAAMAVTAGPGTGVLDLNADETLAPYRFVVQYADHAAAAWQFTELRNSGAGLETWPDLAPEVLAQEDRHADAIRLRRTQIFFPVHG